MKKLTIAVTQSDVASGQRDTNAHCPFALAMKRAGKRAVHVGRSGITWKEGKLKFEAEMTTNLRNFLWSVDAGRNVKPRSFTIEPKRVR